MAFVGGEVMGSGGGSVAEGKREVGTRIQSRKLGQDWTQAPRQHTRHENVAVRGGGPQTVREAEKAGFWDSKQSQAQHTQRAGIDASARWADRPSRAGGLGLYGSAMPAAVAAVVGWQGCEFSTCRLGGESQLRGDWIDWAVIELRADRTARGSQYLGTYGVNSSAGRPSPLLCFGGSTSIVPGWAARWSVSGVHYLPFPSKILDSISTQRRQRLQQNSQPPACMYVNCHHRRQLVVLPDSSWPDSYSKTLLTPHPSLLTPRVAHHCHCNMRYCSSEPWKADKLACGTY